jgi:hypothetical protein
MWDRTVAYNIFMGIPEGKRPLGRPRRRLENNIEMYLQNVGWGQDRDSWRALLNAPINSQVTQNAGNFLTS